MSHFLGVFIKSHCYFGVHIRAPDFFKVPVVKLARLAWA